MDASVADALDEDFHGRKWTVIIVITVITVIEMIYRRCEFSEVQAFEAWESSHEFQMYPSPNLCQLPLEAPLAALEFELRNVFQLHLQKERPVFVKGTRLHIEGRGPVVEFFLQGQQLGSDALGS